MQDPIVWIVGDWRRGDYSDAIAWLKSRAICICFDDATAVFGCHEKAGVGQGPDVMLLIQSRPGQITHNEVERFHATAPLAQLVAVVGPWCDGEMRSGHPLPGVVRIPWHAWQYRLGIELGLSPKDGIPTRLPRTVTATERIEAMLATLTRPDAPRGVAAVVTSRRATYESIADLFQQLGFTTHWHTEDASSIGAVDQVVFDGWQHVLAPQRQHSGDNSPNPPQQLLLLHFPAAGDLAQAAGRGISVLAQPLLLADLAVALDRSAKLCLPPKISPALTLAASRN